MRLLCLVTGCLGALIGHAAPLSFDVAEIKANKSGQLFSSLEISHGRLIARNAPMKSLITAAYHVNTFGIVGGPAWLASERFDIMAKADPTTSDADVRVMLQSLLVERFKLHASIEKRTVPVFALVVGKKAMKLEEAPPASEEARVGCPGVASIPGHIVRECHGVTMAFLAAQLPEFAPAYFDQPVVDMSDLKGTYSFKLDWAPRGALDGVGHNDPSGRPVTAPGEFGGGVTIFGAIEQLGLKLENRKHPVDMVVIESIERVPVEN